MILTRRVPPRVTGLCCLTLVLSLPGVRLLAQGPGSALAFQSSEEDYVHIPSFDLTGEITVEAWMKPNQPGAHFLGVIRGTYTPSAPDDCTQGGGSWMILQGSSTWGFLISTPSTNTAFSPQGSVQVGEWQHIAGTFDQTTIRLYKNGVLVAELAHGSPGPVSDAANVVFGCWESFYDGVLDEVRIWNVARSQEQIASSMRISIDPSEPGLVGYWRLDSGGGQKVLDLTTNQNDGQLGSTSGVDLDDPTWIWSSAPMVLFADTFESGDTSVWSSTVP
jgi:hypothetical protein